MSAVGKTLSPITLKATQVGEVALPTGRWTVLYFYPKDDTPGCTKQACTYRDMKARFEEAGIDVFGISMDDMASHDAFESKFTLNFPLLSDPDHALGDALGSYGDQRVETPEGKVFEWTGLSRDSFLIDPEGKVVQEWRRIDPVEGVQQTLEAAKAAKIA